MDFYKWGKMIIMVWLGSPAGLKILLDLFVEGSKQRFRIIDLASENALPFLPHFNSQNPSMLPGV